MNATVLVVEDNEALAENIAELFEEAGATVTICHSAKGAIDYVRSQPFDLAIVDLRLQGEGDGLSLVPLLRDNSPYSEIVLVTGNASLDSAMAAVRHGVYAYVLKPFDPDDLLALGHRALAQVHLRKERESLARELASSEALYRGIVDTVEALIFGIDRHQRITFCNRFASTVLGCDPDDVGGKDFASFFDDSHDADLRKLLRRASRGEPVRERLLTTRSASGDSKIVRWSLIPLQAGQSGSQSEVVLAVGIDETERLELERKSAENAAMAAMGQLATGLAHEIRNPLNAAKLQLELLERSARKLDETGDGPRIRERAGIVREEIQSLSRMLEEFLSLARPRRLERRELHLGGLVSEVVGLHGPVAEEKGISLEGDIPSDIGAVWADRERVKQALVNLVGNALDAMAGQAAGAIRIEVREGDDNCVEVAVHDTGHGLEPEVAESIFQPFVTTKPAGTGLGLSIVKRTIELHGGRVWLESGAEGGAVARFTLPRAPSGVTDR